MNPEMNDAISRNALYDRLHYFKTHSMRQSEYAYETACREVATAPALDVQPVVHARWIIEKDKAIFCDECCHKLPIVIYNIKAFESLKHHLPKYCPECGAKMDAKEDNRCTD